METEQTYLGYFSETVPQAEDRFLRACKAVDVAAELLEYPAMGPDGESLHVGVCRVGAKNAENLLFVLSGTHGIEGYAGAAIQTGLLHNLHALQVPENTAILMIHLINPWGAAWNRRETEDNIDLFRNFHYCDAPIKPDPLFDEIDDAIGWENWPKSSAVDKVLEKYGAARVVAAVRRGQHHRPKSMTFHGNGPCTNKRILDRVLVDHAKGAKRISVLDIHTGFGAYGGGAIVAYDEPGSVRYQTLKAWFGEGLYTPGTDADTPTHAISPYSFISKGHPKSEVICSVLEFGTYPPDVTRELFLASSYHHNYGDPTSTEACEVGLQYRAFCYPEKPDWKKAIWERGLEVTAILLAGFDHWPSLKQ